MVFFFDLWFLPLSSLVPVRLFLPLIRVLFGWNVLSDSPFLEGKERFGGAWLSFFAPVPFYLSE